MSVGQLARAALPMAIFFTVIPGLLLLGEHPGTAGFVITVFTLAIGVLLLIAVFLTLFLTRRSPE